MNSDKALQAYTDNFPALEKLPEIISQVRPETHLQAFQSKTPSLAAIRTKYGQTAASMTVASCVMDICLLCAFEVNKEWVKAVADEITDRWFDIKLAELKLFKIQFMSGEVGARPGKTFRLDAKVFLEAFADFYAKRSEEISDYLEQKHKEPPVIEKTGKEIPMPDYVRDNMERLAKKKHMDRFLADQNRPVFRSRLMLQEICESEGIDFSLIESKVMDIAKKELEENTTKLSLDELYGIGMIRVQFEARKDPKILHELI